MGDCPSDDARGSLDLHPPCSVGERAFVREILAFHQFAVMPHLPSALAKVVQDVDHIAGLHFGIRVVVRCDHAQRNAVDLTGNALDFLTFMESRHDFFSVGLVH